MSDTIRCPDCGQENEAAATACVRCGFPLAAPGAPAAPEPRAAAPGAAPPLRRGRLTRMRRPQPQQGLVLTLWLTFGILCAVVVVFVAVKGYQDSNFVPVPGSNRTQQERADSLRTVLARDSTDVHAQVFLADILYDTAN